MTIRPQTLWRVPVFCAVASAVTFYLTVYLADSSSLWRRLDQTEPRYSPLTPCARPSSMALCSCWCWCCWQAAAGLPVHDPAGIAVSAAIFAGIDLVLCLIQLLAPDLLLPLLFPVTLIQNWTAAPTSALYHLTGHLPVSALVACLAPFLFVPFGKRSL